jgi:hypothetical protein
MAKRINVVLSDETVKTVHQAAKPGERSRFIDRAVLYYAATHSAKALQESLKRAAVRDRDLAEEIGRDWFAVDREAWQTAEERAVRRSTRSAAKSTSSRSIQR